MDEEEKKLLFQTLDTILNIIASMDDKFDFLSVSQACDIKALHDTFINKI